MRTQVQSLASLSGLRIRRCHELWCRLAGCSFYSSPSLGTSVCHECGPKKTKNKLLAEKQEFPIRFHQEGDVTCEVAIQKCKFFGWEADRPSKQRAQHRAWKNSFQGILRRSHKLEPRVREGKREDIEDSHYVLLSREAIKSEFIRKKFAEHLKCSFFIINLMFFFFFWTVLKY